MTHTTPAHFLHGLTPDPDAVTDARAFTLMLPEARHVRARLEDLISCCAYFVQRHAGPRPSGTAHTEALHVLTFAASGLWAFLEDAPTADPWATLTRARLWAVERCQRHTAHLTRQEVEALHVAFNHPHTLPAWAAQVRQAGRDVEGGRLAAWWAVSHLLEALPHLEDGEAEDLTDAVLKALEGPHGTPAPFLPFPAPQDSSPAPVYTAQYVEHLAPGLARVGMGGGEDYLMTRDTCRLTPLPDGSAFAVLTVEDQPLTIRLTPEDARTIRAALALPDPGESEDGPASPLN